ncbi:hypothetical protein DFH28DRAFT_983181 [Melampsora americana]|nr:hypothetical protein DFH28DRAFT_983181 [Melampsora americana]
MPGPTSQTTSQVENQPATSTLKADRVIPGLTAAPASTTSAAKRSRKKKTASTSGQIKSDQPSTVTPATHNVENASAPSAPVVVGGLGITLEPPSLTLNSHSTATPIPSQPVSPVQQVQKRIRAATKKMQRIAGYETSSTPLNEDQKRAIASKPALEATVRELQDLLKILEEDELLDEQRINAVREEEERKVKGRVDAAIAAEQKNADSNLTFLLQFLHLYSLFNAANQPASFVPVMMPPVLETATAQEVAAINALFHQLANGPIAGGGGDAFQSIQSLASGTDTEVIPGVQFARIKEMITQLTAPPAADTSNPSSTEKNHLMFLQHSEVAEEPSIAASPAPAHLSVNPSSHSLTSSPNLSVDHVARNKALLETAQIVSAEPNHAESWNVNPSKEEAPQSSEWSKPTEMLSSNQAEVVARTIDWAEEVDVDAQAPAPDLTPAPPTFPSRGFRGNGGRGGFRGGPRGGPHHDGYRGGRSSGYRGGPPHRGGPGGFRGGGGGSGSGTWRPGPPDGPGNYRPRPEGDFPNNGYRGRGGPRGGGGGYHNRGPPNPSQSDYRPEPGPGNWN